MYSRYRAGGRGCMLEGRHGTTPNLSERAASFGEAIILRFCDFDMDYRRESCSCVVACGAWVRHPWFMVLASVSAAARSILGSNGGAHKDVRAAWSSDGQTISERHAAATNIPAPRSYQILESCYVTRLANGLATSERLLFCKTLGAPSSGHVALRPKMKSTLGQLDLQLDSSVQHIEELKERSNVTPGWPGSGTCSLPESSCIRSRSH